MDFLQTTTFWAGLCSLVTGVLTFACTKGVDAWQKVRANNRKEVMEERQYEDRRVQEATDTLVGELRNRVHALETACADMRLDHVRQMTELRQEHAKESAALRSEHLECLKRAAAQDVQLALLTERVAALWRHDEANKENVVKLASKLEEAKAASEAS